VGAVQRAEMPAKPAVMTGARCTRRTVLAPDRSPALVMVDGALAMAVAMLPGFVARLPLLLVSRLAVGAGEAGMTGCVNQKWIWPTFRDRLGPGVSHGQVIALS
jgi:hypothetical protein